MTGSISPALIAVAAGACLAAAAIDVRSFRVPNWLTFPLLAAGLLARSYLNGWPGLGDALAGAGFGFGALIWVHAMGGMGAGDVKLATAVGAWLGPWLTAHVLLFAALASGMYAMVVASATGRVFEVLARVPLLGPALLQVPTPSATSREALAEELKRPDRRARVIPFAAMIAIGLAIALVLR